MFGYLLILCASIHGGFAHPHGCVLNPCADDQICVVQDGRPVCLSNTRLCSTWGESHYHILDGRTFDFHGTCNYMFARAPCRVVSSNDITPIKVQIARLNTANATASFDRVFVDVQGFAIMMVKGELQQFWVNGLKHLLPCNLTSTLRLFPSGSAVVLETGFGLVLRYDWLHRLEVRVSPELSSAVCGLCGGSGRRSIHNLPGPIGHPLPHHNATVAVGASVLDFARSWRTGGNRSLCSDDCGGSCPHCEPAQLAATPGVRACSVLQDPRGPFVNCLQVFNPAPYVVACKDDLCTRNGDHVVACRALKAFADACQGSGIRISPWRELANCSMACAANSHYEICGSLCPATCGDPVAPSQCQSGCVETCQCDQGFLLSAQGCVQPSQCGCTHQGSYRLLNETFWAPRCHESCTCSPATRTVTCVPARCEHDEKCLLRDGVYSCHKGPVGLCMAKGDPHYTTFDGRRFDFHGNCMYLLALHCPISGSLPDFKIEVQNERRADNVSFSKMVRTRLHGYEIQISFDVENKVLVNGLLLGLPTVLSFGKVIIYKTGLSMFVESDFGLMLTYNWNNLVTLAIPRHYSGAMCGICGNFNGDKNDDLGPPRSSDANSFVSLIRWKTSEIAGCSDMVDYMHGPCPNKERLMHKMEDSCGMITDPNGPFRDCHDTVAPLDPFENCVTDLHLNNASRAVLCQNLASYVAACQDAGAEVHSWRSPTFCSMACPANSSYALCPSPINNTCAEPPSLHSTVCQEACQCMPGFFRSGERCVPEAECGCLHDGVYHDSGEMFFPDELCLAECTCEGHGQVRCRNTTCPAGTRCGVQNGERACYPEPTTPVPEPIVPSTNVTMPVPETIAPSTNVTMPVPETIAPSTNATMPVPEPIAPSTNPTTPIPEPRTPSANATMPAPEPIAPSTNATMPVPEPIAPSTNPTTPVPEPIAPSTNVTTPVPEPRTPSTHATTPVSEPRTPSTSATTPVPEPRTPFTSATTPVPEPIAPSTNPTTPVPEPRTPSTNATTPVPEPRTPSTNATTPVPEPIAPSTNPTTPVPEPRTPSTSAMTPVPEPRTPSTNATTPVPEPIAPFTNPTTLVPEPRTPSTSATTPVPEPRTPSTNPTTPVPEPIAPSTNVTMPVPEPIAPSTNPTTPVPEPRTPSTNATTPVPEPIAPSTNPTTPVPEPRTPSTNATTPVPEPRTPSTSATTPVPEPIAPSTNPTTPVPEPRTPSTSATTPVPEPRTPSTSATTPVPEPRTPSTSATTPVPEPIAPSTNPTTPVPEPRTPSTNATTPVPEPIAPSTNPTTPVPEPRTPSTSATTPVPEPRTPSTSATTPVPEPRTPSTSATTPVPEPIAPSTNPTTPVPEPRTPSTSATTPVPEPRTPSTNATTPVPEPIAPSTNPTTPVPEPRTPSTSATTPIPEPRTPSTSVTTPVPEPRTPSTSATTPVPEPRTPSTSATTPVPEPIAPSTNPTTPVPEPIAPSTNPTTPVPEPIAPSTNPTTPVPEPIAPSTNGMM